MPPTAELVEELMARFQDSLLGYPTNHRSALLPGTDVCQWALRIRRVEGMLPWSERPDTPDAAKELGWAAA